MNPAEQAPLPASTGESTRMPSPATDSARNLAVNVEVASRSNEVAYMAELSEPPSEEPELGRTLTELERNVLETAQVTAPTRPGPRERYIRERLDMSPTRYFQLLNALLAKPAAWEAKPALMRLLDARRQRNRDRYW
jgi:hypothetical protein